MDMKPKRPSGEKNGSRYASGLQGEAQAEAYLVSRGMVCLARRYRALDGEIDLVMQDGDTIVFVEVKYRPTARPGAGLLAVTPAKRRRMLHAATAYLVEHNGLSHPARFDVIEITAGGVGYIPNAFGA